VLAQLDIAVVAPTSDKVVALLEIEETTDKPKVLLGDVLAMLLGDAVKFQGKRDLQVGSWTTLVVLGRSRTQPHPTRIAFLREQANHLKAVLSTSNAAVGQIVIDHFHERLELERKVRQWIQYAVNIALPNSGQAA
jgi:hypothetical protein